MNKSIIGKSLVVFAIACLTFIFAALSMHYDVFAVGFRDDPINWSETCLMLGAIVFVGIIGTVFACLALPEAAGIILMPFAMWDYISQKHGKWRHLINVLLLILCAVFDLYATNLVRILEQLSGEHFRQEPTFGGLLAVLYVWVIIIGTFILFGWLSDLSNAFDDFMQKAAEAERQRKVEQEKLERKREKRRLKRKRGRKHKAQLQPEISEEAEEPENTDSAQ